MSNLDKPLLALALVSSLLIILELIKGLLHPDTISRYSAAKYLPRLSLVLPPNFAAQVVEAVLSTFEEVLAPAEREGGTGEGKAQGACLAIGEMARRGLLSRQQEGQKDLVARVLDCTLQALAYDHLTSLHPVGSSPQVQRGRGLSDNGVCFHMAFVTLWLVNFFTISVVHQAFLQAAVGVAKSNDYRSRISDQSKTKDVAKVHGLLLSLAAIADMLQSLSQWDNLRLTVRNVL
ncbi:uncharacterized protein JCM10292_005751 [Rhodotorula paludigena]|uniref:uncharacterized protein n=1 Tax=Rhodotorula paludigena TaxID=86838 RepID=UPI00316DA49C